MFDAKDKEYIQLLNQIEESRGGFDIVSQKLDIINEKLDIANEKLDSYNLLQDAKIDSITWQSNIWGWVLNAATVILLASVLFGAK